MDETAGNSVTKKYLIVVLLTLIILFVFVVIFKVKFDSENKPSKSNLKIIDQRQELEKSSKQTYVKNSSPLPLPQGKQTYLVSSKPLAGEPTVKEISLDPFDPKIGETQSVWVKVDEKSQTDKVVVILATDKLTKEYVLEAAANGKQIVWTSSWKSEDTHNNNYIMTVKASNLKASSVTTLSLR